MMKLMQRRSLRCAIWLLAMLVLTAPAAKAADSGYTPATPEPGTEIPQVTVTFGMRPYADNTFYVIGIEKGWFNDVGITIQPEPYGLKTTENQWVSILLNRQVDINSATCSILLPSYKSTDQLKCTGLAVTFYGSVMLASPKLGLKTVRDYAAGGASFEEALRQALTPLVGKTVYVPAAVSEKEFNEVPFELAGLELPNYVTMDDSQMLLLAKSGRLDFMHPGGAPIAQTLLDAGWTPVYDTGQLLEFGPGGLDSPLEPLVFNNGWASTADYVNNNQTTMMRFASVVFRIFDALEKDPSLYGVYTPYLNSVAGTSLDGDGVRRTVENLDPFVPFEEQTKYFVDKESPEYYANSMGALIKSLEESGTIASGITPDQIIWAAPMYHEMVGYKEKAEALFAQAEGQQLDEAKQQLLDQARQFYDWYDFLDAYRLATAALEK
jgi:ABC-type nitrate/sulfonate/bicarbonate transport system substrate-binding protein